MGVLDTEIKLEKKVYASRSYILSEKKIEGYVDEAAALKQSIYKTLSTEQFEYPIYSFNYGLALRQIIGEERPYVRAELKRMITEALEQDDRILEVDGFKFSFAGDVCQCSFNVSSIYGNAEIETEVTI